MFNISCCRPACTTLCPFVARNTFVVASDSTPPSPVPYPSSHTVLLALWPLSCLLMRSKCHPKYLNNAAPARTHSQVCPAPGLPRLVHLVRWNTSPALQSLQHRRICNCGEFRPQKLFPAVTAQEAQSRPQLIVICRPGKCSRPCVQQSCTPQPSTTLAQAGPSSTRTTQVCQPTASKRIQTCHRAQPRGCALGNQ